jgi:hypothetical protein
MEALKIEIVDSITNQIMVQNKNMNYQSNATGG